VLLCTEHTSKEKLQNKEEVKRRSQRSLVKRNHRSSQSKNTLVGKILKVAKNGSIRKNN